MGNGSRFMNLKEDEPIIHLRYQCISAAIGSNKEDMNGLNKHHGTLRLL